MRTLWNLMLLVVGVVSLLVSLGLVISEEQVAARWFGLAGAVTSMAAIYLIVRLAHIEARPQKEV